MFLLGCRMNHPIHILIYTNGINGFCTCVYLHVLWCWARLHASPCLHWQSEQAPTEVPHSRPPIRDSTRDNTASFHTQRQKSEVRHSALHPPFPTHIQPSEKADVGGCCCHELLSVSLSPSLSLSLHQMPLYFSLCALLPSNVTPYGSTAKFVTAAVLLLPVIVGKNSPTFFSNKNVFVWGFFWWDALLNVTGQRFYMISVTSVNSGWPVSWPASRRRRFLQGESQHLQWIHAQEGGQLLQRFVSYCCAMEANMAA